MISVKLRIYVVAVVIGFPAIAHAASFDCRAIDHPNVKQICQSKVLSTLDDDMAAVFDSAGNYISSS